MVYGELAKYPLYINSKLRSSDQVLNEIVEKQWEKNCHTLCIHFYLAIHYTTMIILDELNVYRYFYKKFIMSAWCKM